ncbi:MAG TPA: protease pro-enzyme activation domain-containing protein, partial [Anaerolineaceae bacterium]
MKRRTTLSVVLILTLVVNVLMVTTASAASTRSVLKGSAPSWANAKNQVGSASASADIGFRVYLGWKNSAAVEALAKAVSDPHSAQYGQYLSAAQLRQQFAPSQGDVVAVQSWLRSQGFSVLYTPTNNHYVAAEGTVAQAQSA